MSQTPAVSLVVVSRGRPLELRRALRSFSDLDYRPFEVIVVSEIDPAVTFPELPNIENVIHVPFDQPNISVARNLGIDAASGEIIAFCDDDAVPEPTWLNHLTAPFTNSEVGSAGGYVRGRNGISFQWKANRFDNTGFHQSIELSDKAATILQGDQTSGIKTEGTNCAFRRSALVELNGFDEGFRFYLDETDLNFRLGIAGWKTAIVPLAQVHHGFAANPFRKSNRAPTSLTEIAASQLRFFSLHTPLSEKPEALARFLDGQRKRLISHMIAGRLEPGEVHRMLDELEKAVADSGTAATAKPRKIKDSPNRLRQFTMSEPKPRIAVYGGKTEGNSLHALARKGVVNDYNITVFLFSLTSVFHRQSYDSRGFWVQHGGLFGRSARADRVFRFWRKKERAIAEADRMATVRPFQKIMTLQRFLKKPSALP